ncbi:hypothetical protein FQA47_008032 [Oryzias melastigma]|uniref:Uncharacterized protein n=1 Tax=Oryzias melastigma TaxID=30732 RepID=A0A834FEP6_ORYME|nr:hypothetical protein FQA47_008032 [Oryzias melastigma]
MLNDQLRKAAVPPLSGMFRRSESASAGKARARGALKPHICRFWRSLTSGGGCGGVSGSRTRDTAPRRRLGLRPPPGPSDDVDDEAGPLWHAAPCSSVQLLHDIVSWNTEKNVKTSSESHKWMLTHGAVS